MFKPLHLSNLDALKFLYVIIFKTIMISNNRSLEVLCCKQTEVQQKKTTVSLDMTTQIELNGLKVKQ